jgi:signal recognition particle subunit SRP54
MLDNLKDNLRGAIQKIVKSSGIDEELIKELSKDVQRALLQSDVNVRLVLEITKNLEERSLNETPPPGLSRKDHIVKILYDELSKLLGNETEFNFQPGKQNKVILLGIQGSGKTTVASKLAKFLTKQGYSVGVIGADTYRPGALVQLRTMCEKSNVEVYGEENNKDSPEIVKNGLKHYEKLPLDIILIDTAGRHKEEQDLLDEMERINKIANPELALLVIDGTIGQQCFSQAEAFHKTLPVGGIIVTKLDSSAKGGGAIAASAATGAQIMYIGTGERIDDLEKFSPTRFVGRLLGMGDIQAVLDLAKRLENEGDDVRLKRISSGKMNMDDFFYQLEEVTKVGSLRGFLDNMPGLSGMVKDDQLDQMEGRVSKWRFIIQSMTKEEKADPDLLNSSRIKRIARGSGWSEHDVKELYKNYKNSKNMMKASKGRQMQGNLRRMGLGKFLF